MRIKVTVALLCLAAILISFSGVSGLAQTTLPLKPTRDIAFKVGEGTMMSVDVSPDGKWLTFDLLGDIYVLPIEGGKAKLVTPVGLAVSKRPRFDPSGYQISYVSDGSGTDNVWTVDIRGGPPALLTHFNANTAIGGLQPLIPAAEWLPGGRSLLLPAAINDGFGLLSVGPRRTGQSTFFSAPDCDVTLPPAISAEGSKVYAICQIKSANYSKVVEIDARDLSYRTLFVPSGDRLVGIRWKRGVLFFATANSKFPQQIVLWARDLGSSQSENVRIGEVTQTALGAVPSFGVTPDGRALIIASDGKLMRLDVHTGVRQLIPFEAEVHKVLGPLTTQEARLSDRAIEVRQILQPRFSPIGGLLVYSAAGKVWLRTKDGRSRRLTKRTLGDDIREFDPTFSPDGRWVAFTTWSEKDGGQLWKVRIDGGDPIALPLGDSSDRAIGAPHWSPDGRKIAFVIARVQFVALEGRGPERRGINGDGTLGWIDSDGGEIHLLEPIRLLVNGVAEGSFNHDIVFSSDGQRLYFWTPVVGRAPLERGGAAGIVAMRLNVANLSSPSASIPVVNLVDRSRLLLSIRGEPSPNGEWLAIEQNREILLVNLERDTREQQVSLIEPCLQRSNCQESYSGHRIVQITKGGGSAPTWSSDGKWLSWHQSNSVFRSRLDDLLELGVDAPREHTEIELSLPRDFPRRPLLLRGARIITMADHRVIEHGDLLLEGRRIIAVTAEGMIKPSPNTVVIELSGRTIVPGFVGLQDAKVELSALTPFTTDDRPGLDVGITTSWSPGRGNEITLSGEEARQIGAISGTRNLMPGCGTMAPTRLTMSSQRDIEIAVQRCAALSGDAMQEIYFPTTRQQRQWAVVAGHRYGIPISSEGNGYYVRIGEILDGVALLEHPNGPTKVYQDFVGLLTRSGSAWNADGFAPHSANARDILRAGAIVGLSEEHAGTIVTIDGQARNTMKFGAVGGMLNFVTNGGKVTAFEGLHMLTRGGARALGFDRDLGSIEIGKVADLVILQCNPLEDVYCVTKLSHVVQDGWLYETPSLRRLNH